MANTFGVSKSQKHAKTPLETAVIQPYSSLATANQIHEYQRRIGHLTYPANTCRPDIAYTTQKLASYLKNPSPEYITWFITEPIISPNQSLFLGIDLYILLN